VGKKGSEIKEENGKEGQMNGEMGMMKQTR
jgi:hypothetical protein